jgi:hypothetical protein
VFTRNDCNLRIGKSQKKGIAVCGLDTANPPIKVGINVKITEERERPSNGIRANKRKKPRRFLIKINKKNKRKARTACSADGKGEKYDSTFSFGPPSIYLGLGFQIIKY